MTFYKVLVGGRSCHGGGLQYSLPNGKPGQWHEIKGALVQCERGFHLTAMPGAWWKEDAECYEAEYEGEALPYTDSDHKICVRKVRLLRKIEGEELTNLGVVLEGETLAELKKGMVAAVWGGTIQNVEGGTIQNVEGGTIQNVRGGYTTIILYAGNLPEHISQNAVVIDRRNIKAPLILPWTEVSA